MKPNPVRFFAILAGFAVLSFTATTRAQLVADGATAIINGVTNSIVGGLTIGTNGSFTTLIITNAGFVTNSGAGTIGFQSSAKTNQVIVTGTNSRWSNGGSLSVGSLGAANRLIVTNGGTINNTSGTIGGSSLSSGNLAMIAGAGSVWTNSADLEIGRSGSFNQLLVSNGGKVVNDFGKIGAVTDGKFNLATVTGSNSVWTSTNILYVGLGGSVNQLVVSNGGLVQSVTGDIGFDSASSNNTAMVTGTNSAWTSSFLNVGYFGSGNQLLITDAGTAVANNCYVGRDAASSNNAIVISGGTLIATNATGTGVADVRRGTLTLNSGLLLTDRLLLTNGTSGQLAFNGGTAQTRGTTNSNGLLFTVGNGTDLATLELLGSGMHVFASGLQIANNALLKGNGTVMGNITNASGGTLSPGASIGRLTMGSNLVLAASCTNIFEINKTSATNDVVTGLSNVTYGGRLIVSNLSGTLTNGDTFKLFSAASYAGVFANLDLPPLAPGLTWSNKLLLDGSIQVVTIPPGDRHWTNVSGGSYAVAANWLGSAVPTAIDNANFTSNASYQVDWTADAVAANAYFNARSGTVTQAVGSFAWTITNSYVVGRTAGSTAVVFHATGTLNVTNPAGAAQFVVGQNGKGTQNLNGGMVVADQLFVTNNGVGYTNSTFNFNHGVLTTRNGSAIAQSNDFLIGSTVGQSASWTLQGGTNTIALGAGKSTLLGSSAGSRAYVTVTGINSVWNNSGDIVVGENGSSNRLALSGGAVVIGANGRVGRNSGSTSNEVWVAGTGSVWTNSGNVTVGQSGWGNALTISNAGRIESFNSYLGFSAVSSNNVALITGAGSVWNTIGALVVGSSGPGNMLVVSNGGHAFSQDGSIGSNPSARGNTAIVTGTNSAWTTIFGLRVGNDDSFNQMIIDDGGQAGGGEGAIGYTTGASNNLASVSGAGSLWSNTTDLYVGYSGSGNQLLVANAGTVTANNFYLGFDPSSVGNSATLSGGNLIVTNSAGTSITDVRRGTITLNSGLLRADQLLVTNAPGQLIFNGGTLITRGGAVSNGPASIPFVVGVDGSTPAVWDLRAGLPFVANNSIILGSNSPNNSLYITNGGVLTNANVFVGYTAASSSNVVTITGANSRWSKAGDFNLGLNGSFNRLVVSDGGLMEGGHSFLGANTSSGCNEAIVSGTNSVLTNRSLYVGLNGSFNQLLVTNSGLVQVSFSALIGNTLNSKSNVVLVTGANSTWLVTTTNCWIGNGGSFSQLQLSNAGTLDSRGLIMGNNPSSSNNSIIISGGNLIATNSGAAVTDVRRGALILNSGLILTDSLLLTNGTSSGFSFSGGTLQTRSTTKDNGSLLTIGNGTTPATLELLGTGTHIFNFGLQIASNAVFKGNGTAVGSVTINSGGMLSPGASIGKLTVSGNLALVAGSSSIFEVNKATATNDVVTGLTSVTYGGTLAVTNLSGTLTNGDSFKLFNATSYSGAFSALAGPSPGAGLKWNLTRLPVDGMLRVVPSPSVAPVIGNPALLNGTNLVFSATNGVPFDPVYLLTSTNVALPLTNWDVLATNYFTTGGTVNFTNIMTLDQPRQFFSLRVD